MENCNFYISEIPCLSPVAGIPARQVRQINTCPKAILDLKFYCYAFIFKSMG